MIHKLIKKYTEILNTLEQNNSIKDSTDYYPYNIDIKNTKEYLNDLKDLAINYTHSSLLLKEKYKKDFDDWFMTECIETDTTEIFINDIPLNDGDTLLDVYESIKDNL